MQDTLTIERLRELLDYDGNTGTFTWKTPTNRRVRCGSVAGNIDPIGYVRIRIDGKLHHAHRLAWLHTYGEWPIAEIDHKDRDRANNRINNLREATSAQNKMNKPIHRNNKSGFKGVTFHPRSKKWRAIIRFDNKIISLGLFATPQAASAAYNLASKKYQGEFSHIE